MPDPHTTREFLECIDQVLFELDALLESIGYDEKDDFEPFTPVYERLKKELLQLREAVAAGRHEFATGRDLPFMRIVQRYGDVIPFHRALHSVNDAHLSGLIG